MADKELVDRVRALCDQITKDSVDSLLTNPSWGSVNFNKARPGLDFAYGIAIQLKDLPLELLPQEELQALLNVLASFPPVIDKIRKYTIEQSDAIGVRNNTVSEVTSYASVLYQQAQLRVPFLAMQRGDVRRNEVDMADALARAQQILVNAEKGAKETQKEADDIVKAMRDASATVGVAHFTTDFSSTATQREKQSKHWLCAAVVTALLTIAVALAFAFLVPASGDVNMHNVQLFTSKLVALGVLFTATVWCGRIYKASKHQEAVNRHRADALKTFQAFVKATSDEGTRDAVLLETTRSIFALGSTGYLDGSDSAGGDGSLKVLEIMKTAATAATK